MYIYQPEPAHSPYKKRRETRRKRKDSKDVDPSQLRNLGTWWLTFDQTLNAENKGRLGEVARHGEADWPSAKLWFGCGGG